MFWRFFCFKNRIRGTSIKNNRIDKCSLRLTEDFVESRCGNNIAIERNQTDVFRQLSTPNEPD